MTDKRKNQIAGISGGLINGLFGGGDGCEWIIWILLLSCFCGGGNNCGCGCNNTCC